MLKFTGVGDPDRYEDVWNPFREAAKPFMEQTVGELSISDLSHSVDDALLKGPPRVMNAGCVVTNLWPGMAEELWQTFITYTASSPDVVNSMVALEFHATRRNRPVRMHDQLLPLADLAPVQLSAGSANSNNSQELSCFPIDDPVQHAVVIHGQ